MAEPVVNLPDVDPLPGNASSWAPGESAPRDDVTGKMANVQREKIAATDKIYGDLSSTIDRALPRIEQLSKNAGVEAEKLKPWNADEEAAKRRTDPIEAFGSFGSIFGILASSFTHAPMENSLNASAAAMNAIKAGDDKAYDRAAKAWQDNLKMTMDRHKIQHDAYQDAREMLATNMQASQLKMQVLAARFGDKQVQTLLDAGMSKEVDDLLAARQRNAIALQEIQPKLFEQNMIMGRYLALGGDKNPQSEASQKAWMTLRKENAQMKQMEHGGGLSLGREDAQEVASRTAKYEANGMSHEDAFNKARSEITQVGKKAGATQLTTDRQIAADVAKARERWKSEGKTDSEIADLSAKETARLKTESASITGNRRDDLTGKINRVDLAESLVDNIDNLLLKHRAITGIGGMLTRPAEVVSNIIGGNETDRKQFQRDVETMRLMAPRILLDTQGRPISAEADRVNTMIAGLSFGDTGPNSIRAYVEFRKQLEQIKGALKGRRGDTGDETETKPKASKSQAPWERDPEVK